MGEGLFSPTNSSVALQNCHNSLLATRHFWMFRVCNSTFFGDKCRHCLLFVAIFLSSNFSSRFFFPTRRAAPKPPVSRLMPRSMAPSSWPTPSVGACVQRGPNAILTFGMCFLIYFPPNCIPCLLSLLTTVKW